MDALKKNREKKAQSADSPNILRIKKISKTQNQEKKSLN
jgi:hypothetical protein